MSSQPTGLQDNQSGKAYLQYYGLTQDPFAAPEQMSFVTGQHEKLLRLLNHLLSFSHKLIVLTGSRAVGKSQLLEALAREKPTSAQVSHMKALSADSPAQMLREVASGFRLDLSPDVSKEQAQASLKRFLAELQEERQCGWVLVDDAHLLHLDVLSVLCDLAFENSDVLHMILCGESGLMVKLKSLTIIQKNAQLLYHHALRSFNIKECRQYLFELFKRCGQEDKIPFKEADYLKIYQQSKGQPLQIIRCAERLLIEGADRLLARNHVGGWAWVSGGVLALALAFVVTAWFWPELDATDSPPAKQVTSIPLNQVRSIERHPPAQSAVRVKPMVSALDDADKAKLEPVLPQAKAEPQPDMTQSPEDEVKQDLIDTPKDFALESQTQLIATPPAPERVEQKELPVSGKVVGANASPSAPEPAKPKAVARADSTSAFARRLQKDQARIAALNPKMYTLQLLGSHEEKSILGLLQSLPEDDQYMLFQTEHKGKAWYVLVYGGFGNRQQAEQAAKDLPKQLNAKAAWIRSVASVQQQIR